jgi:hypothetical protein
MEFVNSSELQQRSRDCSLINADQVQTNDETNICNSNGQTNSSSWISFAADIFLLDSEKIRNRWAEHFAITCSLAFRRRKDFRLFHSRDTFGTFIKMRVLYKSPLVFFCKSHSLRSQYVNLLINRSDIHKSGDRLSKIPNCWINMPKSFWTHMRHL